MQRGRDTDGTTELRQTNIRHARGFYKTPINYRMLVDSPVLRTTMSSDPATPLPEVHNPLYVSLLASVASPGVVTLDMVTKNIATENNPCPLKTKMDNGAEYWVDNRGELLTLRFPARLDYAGKYSRLGPYFNLPETGVSRSSSTNSPNERTIPAGYAHAQKGASAVRIMSSANGRPESVNYPPSAVECSQMALETLFALTTEVEELQMTCKHSLTGRM